MNLRRKCLKSGAGGTTSTHPLGAVVSPDFDLNHTGVSSTGGPSAWQLVRNVDYCVVKNYPSQSAPSDVFP